MRHPERNEVESNFCGLSEANKQKREAKPMRDLLKNLVVLPYESNFPLKSSAKFFSRSLRRYRSLVLLRSFLTPQNFDSLRSLRMTHRGIASAINISGRRGADPYTGRAPSSTSILPFHPMISARKLCIRKSRQVLAIPIPQKTIKLLKECELLKKGLDFSKIKYKIKA